MDRIKWVKGYRKVGPCVFNGYLGKIRIFTVSYSTRGENEYLMGSDLPCRGVQRGSLDDLKAMAEGILDGFLDDIGAELKEES